MKHCSPFTIDEASLSRAYQHVVQKKSDSWGMLTAYRAANTKKENEAHNKQLEKDLRSKGYGFFKVEGHWQECQDKNVSYKDCPKDKLQDSTETSLFVPNIKRDEMESLCKKYEQDAVIYGDKNNDAHLIYKNGESENIGEFQPQKVSQAYSKLKGGRTFIFSKDKKEPAAASDGKRRNIFGRVVGNEDEPNIKKLKSLIPKHILNKTLKNPDTGKNIQVKSALTYNKKSPVYGIARQLIKRAA
jgi:hypothetical protein